MTLTLIVVIASVAVMLGRGWKKWPERLAPVHETFRNHGRGDLLQRGWPTSRLINTGLTLDVGEVQFERTATFTLLPPLLSSTGTARTPEGKSVRILAITRYPTLRSYLIVDKSE